jgi:hypothetical protein
MVLPIAGNIPSSGGALRFLRFAPAEDFFQGDSGSDIYSDEEQSIPGSVPSEVVCRHKNDGDAPDKQAGSGRVAESGQNPTNCTVHEDIDDVWHWLTISVPPYSIKKPIRKEGRHK